MPVEMEDCSTKKKNQLKYRTKLHSSYLADKNEVACIAEA